MTEYMHKGKTYRCNVEPPRPAGGDLAFRVKVGDLSHTVTLPAFVAQPPKSGASPEERAKHGEEQNRARRAYMEGLKEQAAKAAIEKLYPEATKKADAK